jgi:hypothetical protein
MKVVDSDAYLILGHLANGQFHWEPIHKRSDSLKSPILAYPGHPKSDSPSIECWGSMKIRCRLLHCDVPDSALRAKTGRLPLSYQSDL